MRLLRSGRSVACLAMPALQGSAGVYRIRAGPTRVAGKAKKSANSDDVSQVSLVQIFGDFKADSRKQVLKALIDGQYIQHDDEMR